MTLRPFYVIIILGLCLFAFTAARAAEKEAEPAVFDPIKTNGEYFVGWKDPKLALVFTGFQEGYMEPCGCAGMLEMKGGLSRRKSFFLSLRDKNWPIVAIDAGDLCSSGGIIKQSEMKFYHTVDAFRLMKYDVIGLGASDLNFSADELLSVTVDCAEVPSPFTGANVAPYGFNPGYLAPYKVIERNGLRIGVVSVLTNELLETVGNPNIVKADPVEKIKEVLPLIDKTPCDFLVLISHGTKRNTMKETQKLLESFPGRFQIVVVSDPPAEPPRGAPKVIPAPDAQGKPFPRFFIEVGEKGKFAVVLGIFDDQEKPTRYQCVALDSRYLNSPKIMDMMKDYQDRLASEGPDKLGIKSYSHPQENVLGRYIGSKECQDCHEIAYDVWRDSKHAKAWKTLTDVANPPRNHDPDCIMCHSVGWNTVEVYPYTSGYDMKDPEKKRHLVNVGCESCHGPGENHKKAELGNNKKLQADLRLAVRLPKENAYKTCITCHDGDNSPHFEFDTYWPKIEHKEFEEE